VAREVHDAGDHLLVVGLVEEFQAHGHAPLLFYRGAFELLPDPAASEPGAEIAREIFTDFPELW
jgi:flavin reductase (DIM6/NTAB) family NADH-FMN oxidoreductase RutF